MSLRFVRWSLAAAVCAAVPAAGAALTVADAGASAAHQGKHHPKKPAGCTGTATGYSMPGKTYYKINFSCPASVSQFTVKTNKTLLSSFGIHAHVDSTSANFTCQQPSAKSYSCHGAKAGAHSLIVTTVASSEGCTNPNVTAEVTADGKTSAMVRHCK